MTSDMDSHKVCGRGHTVRESSRLVSNWRSEQSLDEFLIAQGVVGIDGIDPRVSTRSLRERTSMRSAVLSGDAPADGTGQLLEPVRSVTAMAWVDLLHEFQAAVPAIEALHEEAFAVATLQDHISRMAAPRAGSAV